SRTFGWLCPKIKGPQEQQKSINLFPSASHIKQPSPFSIKRGVPYTDLKARTGECTPPGKYCFAFSYSSADFTLEISGFPPIFIGISPSFPENIFFKDSNIFYLNCGVRGIKAYNSLYPILFNHISDVVCSNHTGTCASKG